MRDGPTELVSRAIYPISNKSRLTIPCAGCCCRSVMSVVSVHVFLGGIASSQFSKFFCSTYFCILPSAQQNFSQPSKTFGGRGPKVLAKVVGIWGNLFSEFSMPTDLRFFFLVWSLNGPPHRPPPPRDWSNQHFFPSQFSFSLTKFWSVARKLKLV